MKTQRGHASRQLPAATLPSRRRGAWPWIAPLVLGCLALGMLRWCWARCPDVLVDYGREAYVPWQLASGKVLYRDLAYFNGPLSPYVNTLWFELFGASIRTLAVANAVLLTLFLVLLYHTLRVFSTRLAAYSALFAVVLAFAFGHYGEIGNYNFIYPYSHEMTHGLILSVASIYCFAKYLERDRLPFAGCAGGFLGLALLTKPEIALALLGALALGLLLAGLARPDWTSAAKLWAAAIGGAVLPPAISSGLLSLAMPPAQAIHGSLSAFAYLGNERLLGLPYYRDVMGTSAARENLLTIGIWLAIYFAAFGLLASVALAVRPSARGRRWIYPGIFAVATLLTAWFAFPVWLQSLKPLPVFVLLAGIAAIAKLWRVRADAAARGQQLVQLVWICFSLLLLLKILLNATVAHYGFALALPAATTSMVVMLDWIPTAIRKRTGSGGVFQAGWLGACAIFVATCLYLDYQGLQTKTFPIGARGDRIYMDAERGPAVAKVLTQIERAVGPEQTLAVFPEGAMLNYLGRRAGSTPYYSFMPPELLMFEEERILADFAAHPPDFIVVVPSNLSAYGYRSFAHDYAMKIAAWADANYAWETPPDPNTAYQLVLLKRIGQPAPQPETGHPRH